MQRAWMQNGTFPSTCLHASKKCFSIGIYSINGCLWPETKMPLEIGQIRKLEKAVAVSGVCAGVLEESSGKIPGKLLENLSRIAKCYKF